MEERLADEAGLEFVTTAVPDARRCGPQLHPRMLHYFAGMCKVGVERLNSGDVKIGKRAS